MTPQGVMGGATQEEIRVTQAVVRVAQAVGFPEALESKYTRLAGLKPPVLSDRGIPKLQKLA